MQHWHDFNPWAEKIIYVPLKELAEALSIPRDVHGTLDIWHRYGYRLDGYILEAVNGNHSAGVRYGEEPDQYLLPYCDPVKLQALIEKYR